MSGASETFLPVLLHSFLVIVTHLKSACLWFSAEILPSRSNAVEVEDEGQDYGYSNWMLSTTTGLSATTLSSASTVLGGERNWNDIWI